MTKKEIKTVPNNKLIVEYVNTYANLLLNFNLRRGTERYENHKKDLEAELLKRGILTEEDVRQLNY